MKVIDSLLQYFVCHFKTKFLLLNILFLFFYSENIFCQSDFQEITRLSNKFSSIGGAQQLTNKWPIPELKDRVQTVHIDLRGLAEIGAEQFILDMNSNPRIIMLVIETRLSNKYDPSEIKEIPLSKLKYIKHLSYTQGGMNDRDLEEFINWEEILEIESLEFLYLNPLTSLGRKGKELYIPKDVITKLAEKLSGYANYGYNGELDNLDERYLQFQFLSLGTNRYQTNKDFKVLKKCNNLKYLGLDVDTLSSESIHDLLSIKNLEYLRINRPTIEFIGNVKLQQKGIELYSLKNLECKSDNLSLFQSIAPQLKTLTLKSANENTEQIEKFLSACHELEELRIWGRGDTILPFELNIAMPLRKFTLAGSYVELPKAICSFDKLEEITLRYNRLKTLPSCIANNSNLKHVNFSGNELVKEPPFWAWSKLESLNLSDNNISEISDNWCNNTLLENLDLSNNPFHGNLESLPCLVELTELKLGNTCIESLPEDIHKLQKLQKLYVNKTRYTSLRTKEKNKCTKSLSKLPKNISKLKMLNYLNLNGQVGLHANDVQLVLATHSDSIEVNFSYCKLDSLPSRNWKNNGVKSLDLAGNNITSIPEEMLETSILKLNLKGNELGQLNQNIKTKTEKLLWQHTAGMDVTDELLKQDFMLDAVIDLGNKYYRKAEDNPILDLIPIIIQLDTLYVLSRLNSSNYGKALFAAERYLEAERYLSMAIKKQQEGCFVFANGISELYLQRHNCYLQMQDTLSALNDLDTIQTKYGFFTGHQSFALNLESNNQSGLEILKPKILEKLKEVYKDKKIKFDALTELSILEIYLVTNDYESFESYNKTLTGINFGVHEPIYKYLQLLYKLINNDLEKEEVPSLALSNIAIDYINSSWSCDYITHWSKQFSNKKQMRIIELNEIICPSTN